ncbi:MAG: citrate/2-methylcitrate synthase [Clostridiales bacterium]|nr:citrate/2-methylcitrate synthase [Clostridiales bacterium]MBS5877602.1 citrate/2-methylcitrate synthase [Clostridiales bacterium]MDU0939513.1 citrate/2-methylcitrate synthase [Clostridiales bacterium]MDU1042045.1 citrate/2-methylcitrate synthase [Clostridiales bacterium]
MKNEDMMRIHCLDEEHFDQLVRQTMKIGKIDPNLYVEYDVKRGLRDSNGNGVLTGLTEISDVKGTDSVNGRKIPIEGELYYQGYEVKDIVNNFKGHRFRFEEITYLLLFGELPSREQLDGFVRIVGDMMDLSGSFVRDVIMKATNDNIMNSMMKSVLTLYSYDDDPENISVDNVLRQSLQLISKIPVLATYGYNAYRHLKLGESLVIKHPKKGCSIAENLLYMIREDGNYTPLEAEVLDICLVLHAEHGGGNNSSFTTHVVTSSGTDTYSAIAAAIASLKGPKHGGANLKVQHMFADIEANVKDWTSKEEVCGYLQKILDKKAFDGSGLIYGMGHAVYTLSDPREVILKEFARKLAHEKGRDDEFALYELVEKEATGLITANHKIFKPVCANVDFYSGLVYSMLGIPEELFTPLFAIARIPGWCAHRLEEIVNAGKIIRPAYRYVGHHRDYKEIDERKTDNISFD